ncbi:MAG: hypothetical protein LBI79_00910 [Nitrososphaerota archaeon]|nr:hypothetical protein [Nitrososphaerota archaeon]
MTDKAITPTRANFAEDFIVSFLPDPLVEAAAVLKIPLKTVMYLLPK